MPSYALRTRAIFVLVAGVLACRADDAPNPVKTAFAQPQRQPTGPSGQAVAFRFATQGGEGVRVYRLPALRELEWRFETTDLAAERVIGFASDEDRIYVVTPDSTIVALDLTTGRLRTLDTSVAGAAFGPTGIPYAVRGDGSLGAVIDLRMEEWADTLRAVPAAMWGTTSGRLVAVVAGSAGRTLTVVSKDAIQSERPLPAGDLARSPWGELVVVAADSGLIAVEPAGDDPGVFVPLDDGIRAVALSAAGHRIYVGTEGAQLVVLDRFQLAELFRQRLPRPLDSIRVDPFGRYLLLRPAGVDSIWIADAVDSVNVLSIAGSWDEDLPAVSPDGIVLVRRGRDVVAVDPVRATEVGAVAEGGADRWLLVAWDPRRPTLQLAAEQAAVTDSLARMYYVQLTATYNQEWATDLATNLRRAGMDSQVLTPSADYDLYRVVLGPYPSRLEADDTGRKLGRPYFIFSRDTTTGLP